MSDDADQTTDSDGHDARHPSLDIYLYGGLEHADRTSERFAILHVLHGRVERPLHDADEFRAEVRGLQVACACGSRLAREMK